MFIAKCIRWVAEMQTALGAIVLGPVGGIGQDLLAPHQEVVRGCVKSGSRHWVDVPNETLDQDVVVTALGSRARRLTRGCNILAQLHVMQG